MLDVFTTKEFEFLKKNLSMKYNLKNRYNIWHLEINIIFFYINIRTLMCSLLVDFNKILFKYFVMSYVSTRKSIYKIFNKFSLTLKNYIIYTFKISKLQWYDI